MDMIDPKVHEELHKRYAQHLAEAMGQTKERIVANLMEAQWAEREKPYIVEVKFDE